MYCFVTFVPDSIAEYPDDLTSMANLASTYCVVI